MAIINGVVAWTSPISHKRVLNKASSSTVDQQPSNGVVICILACVIS